MGNRIFCDQCGNTISNGKPQVMCISQEEYMTREDWQRFYAGSSGGPGLLGSSMGIQAQYPHGQNTQPYQPKTPTFKIELCPTCLPKWVSRVKNLTQASDVQTSRDKAE